MTTTQFPDSATLDMAIEIARYSPRDAIEGWLAGSRALGDESYVDVYTAALEVQDGWRRRARLPIAEGGRGDVA